VKGKLFVTGCPRSGTSLMAVLLNTIPGSLGSYEEGAPSKSAPDGHIIKRPYRPTHPLDIKIALNSGYKVVLMCRDGRDVMTSRIAVTGEYVCRRDQEWCWAIEAQFLPFNGHDDVWIVRYEDLVRKPNEIVSTISKVFSFPTPRVDVVSALRSVPATSTYHSSMNGRLYSINESSVGHWLKSVENRNRIRKVVSTKTLRDRMCSHLIKLGYEKDDLWVSRLGVARESA
jgi:hypothetical protein